MSKFFTNKELENIEISDDVIVSIVAITASEIDGVVPTGAKPATIYLKELISKKGFGKNVTVTEDNGKIAITISITVEYGKPITEICQNVQKAVYDAVTNYTSLEVTSVDVQVGGIFFPKAAK